MTYYDRIEVSEEIDLNTTNESKECDMRHYLYFSNKGFKFQPNVCNGCHDLLMMSISLGHIANLNIQGSDYHCIINRTSKSDAINLMQNIDLTEECGTL